MIEQEHILVNHLKVKAIYHKKVILLGIQLIFHSELLMWSYHTLMSGYDLEFMATPTQK